MTSFTFTPNFKILSFEILRLVFSLQVKDFDKFHFKPGKLVKSITEILLNLGTEKDFCKALVSDKRSYSSNLYKQAVAVLM